GGTEHIGRIEAADESCITDGQVFSLTSLGAKVQAYFGRPQDIEWAIDGAGSLWLTQSRPLTTLFPIPQPRGDSSGHRVYFCFSVAQGLYRPLTPMGLAAFRVLSSYCARLVGIPVDDPLAGAPVYAEAAGRVFIDF